MFEVAVKDINSKLNKIEIFAQNTMNHSLTIENYVERYQSIRIQ
jgi:hypothetical protein